MLNEKGYTLQTVIITSILVLAVSGLSVVIFNVLSSESSDLNNEIIIPSTTLEQQ